MPRAGKPEASGFTLKGRASSRHGLRCQPLSLASGLTPEGFPFPWERRWLQSGLIFKVTTGKRWPPADSLAHQLVCGPCTDTRNSGQGLGRLGQKDESRSVNAGDLRSRGGVQLSPRPGSSSSRSLTLSFPVTPSVPAQPWTCSDNYLRYFPRGPLPLPSAQSTRHKATGWIILKRSAALTLPVTYETKILAFKFPNSFPNNRDYLLWLLF